MQYLLSVIDDSDRLRDRRRDGRDRRVQRAAPGRRATGSSPAASAAPGTPRSSTTAAGEAVFTDGPFVESKEYLAGFWIIEAPDLDVALKLAAEGSKACNRKVEVRPFLPRERDRRPRRRSPGPTTRSGPGWSPP